MRCALRPVLPNTHDRRSLRLVMSDMRLVRSRDNDLIGGPPLRLQLLEKTHDLLLPFVSRDDDGELHRRRVPALLHRVESRSATGTLFG